MWIELIRKIELQSILVLLITLLVGAFLLSEDNSISTPAGVLGSLSIAIGLLYTFGSFFSNQQRESYKDVIEEYKATISQMRSSYKSVEQSYKTLQSTQTQRSIGEYRPMQAEETEKN